MKKTGILNSGLAKIVDDLGHTDKVCIGDLGLPVPAGVPKIDLAVTPGKPSFQEVLDVYLGNVLVEKVYLAEEIHGSNPEQLSAILAKLPAGVEVSYLPHQQLKDLTRQTRAVIRTGEATAFSNIVLQSGVTM